MKYTVNNLPMNQEILTMFPQRNEVKINVFYHKGATLFCCEETTVYLNRNTRVGILEFIIDNCYNNDDYYFELA